MKNRVEVQAVREAIDVPCSRRGRPAYRWTNGYYVIDNSGNKIYPPVVLSEARDLARALYGPSAKIVIID